MRGDITLKILERVKDQTLDGVSLFGAFLTCGYGASFDQIKNKAYRSSPKDLKDNVPKDDWKKINDRFLSMCRRLENDNLIEKSKKDNNYFFRITKKGREKVDALRDKKRRSLPASKYGKKDSSKLNIVMFDIPEKEKRKRDWLRGALLNMGFEMIQKSVWTGNVVISKEFMKNIRDLAMVEFIEIFEVTKQGTLRSLK